MPDNVLDIISNKITRRSLFFAFPTARNPHLPSIYQALGASINMLRLLDIRMIGLLKQIMKRSLGNWIE